MGTALDLSQFFQQAEKLIPQIPNKTAVFDADGTLWREDVGFGFFKYQLEHSLVKNPPDPKKTNEQYKRDPKTVCSRMVQMNQGVSHKLYLSWCRNFVKSQPLNVFSFQRKIISFLKNKGVKIYVVSASPEWVVREAVQHCDLPVDEVVGVKTLVQDGVITDQLHYPLSIADDKPRAFLERSDNVYPFFSAGNTVSDLDLLEFSTHLKLAVASALPGHKHYDSERVLLSMAHQKSWLYKDCLEDL